MLGNDDQAEQLVTVNSIRHARRAVELRSCLVVGQARTPGARAKWHYLSMRRFMFSALVALVLAACTSHDSGDDSSSSPASTATSVVDRPLAETGQVFEGADMHDGAELELELVGGLTATAVPPGYDVTGTEGATGVDYSVLENPDKPGQIAIGRWNFSGGLPVDRSQTSDDVVIDGRVFTVTEYPTGETRVWEDRDDGVRLEVVGRQVDTPTLLEVLVGVRYDADRDKS